MYEQQFPIIVKISPSYLLGRAYLVPLSFKMKDGITRT